MWKLPGQELSQREDTPGEHQREYGAGGGSCIGIGIGKLEEWVSERSNIEIMIKMEITGPRVVTEGGHVR